MWRHLAVLAVVLAVVVALTLPREAATSDEGAYGLEVRALRAGSWDAGYRFATQDPTAAYYPYINAEATEDGFFPLARQPVYEYALSRATDALGETAGLHLLPVLGALAAALAAWIVAGLVDRRLRPWAFWLAATSPLLVNATITWAHALAAGAGGAAVAGGAMVLAPGALPAASRRSAGAAWLLLTAGLATGVVIRTEGILFAAAVLVVLAVWSRRSRARLAGLAAGATAVGGAWIAQRAWHASIIGSGRRPGIAPLGGRGGWLSGRRSALWSDLFNGGYGERWPAFLGLASFLLLLLAGVAASRRAPNWERDVKAFGALAALLWVGRLAAAPHDWTAGLLPAWPVAALAVIVMLDRRGSPVERFLVVVTVTFAALVILVDYPEGGGLQWGGRYLSAAIVPIAVLTAAGLHRVVRPVLVGLSGWRSGAAVGVAVALAVGPSLAGLAVVRNQRATHGAAVRAVFAEADAGVVVTTLPALPRVAWRSWPRVTWLLASEADMAGAAAVVAAAGLDDFRAVTGDVRPAPVVDGWQSDDSTVVVTDAGTVLRITTYDRRPSA